ncbi:carnitine dehydratase [Bosea sp. Root381]|uniref:CaiB/BaiF CoA transferase family protein n=1 Tax=Bosea sp. Root381 TaxID=1736524 RepID=UPI0006FF0EDE|nr:CoA transferase [Bosea sp. Root381]KRE17385.1 carnitine dehydratase [Bosea sp. Root381]
MDARFGADVTSQLEAAGALAGLRVIDLTRVLAGPYCTQILADHGADVLKIEPPQGDETRNWGPPFVGGESSAYFEGVNRNKRGMVLDLASEGGRAQLSELLVEADVLIDNFKPGTLANWGFGRQQLSERFPSLVQCSISGFGADGPLGGLPGYDAAIQAISGLMSLNGAAGGEPVRIGIPVVDLTTGLNAALGIMLALQERRSSGRGQFVDIALYDCALSLLHPQGANFLFSGLEPQRTGSAHPNIAPYDSFDTGNGQIFLAVGNDRQFRGLCEILGLNGLAEDKRFVCNRSRVSNREALREILEDAFRKDDAVTIAEKLIRHSVPCSPVLSVAQALAHPHSAHREMIIERGGYRGIGSPIKFSRSTTKLQRVPPTGPSRRGGG